MLGRALRNARSLYKLPFAMFPLQCSSIFPLQCFPCNVPQCSHCNARSFGRSPLQWSFAMAALLPCEMLRFFAVRTGRTALPASHGFFLNRAIAVNREIPRKFEFDLCHAKNVIISQQSSVALVSVCQSFRVLFIESENGDLNTKVGQA